MECASFLEAETDAEDCALAEGQSAAIKSAAAKAKIESIEAGFRGTNRARIGNKRGRDGTRPPFEKMGFEGYISKIDGGA